MRLLPDLSAQLSGFQRGRHGGFAGIINRIDYLVELGVGAIWLGPVCSSPNDDMGYDISDYQSIMEQFGTMEDWEELRDKLHEKGSVFLRTWW